MSHYKQDDDWLTSVGSTVIAYAFVGLALVVTGVMLVPFALAKRPIARAWGLERHSARWARMSLLYKPLKVLAALLFLLFLTGALSKLLPKPVVPAQIGLALLYFLPSLPCALLFSVLHWLEGYYNDPAIQKKVAGINAERLVQEMIVTHTARYPESRSLHGVLLVFNGGSADEFSVEADHVLVTTRAIYVIETKYKSGTVRATIDAQEWETVSPTGLHGRMRNALRQVKNTVRVLERECVLPCAPIPLVAIVGQQVAIVDGPSNVVAAEDLINTIDAFEWMAQDAAESGSTPPLDPDQIAAALMRQVSADPAARARHNERADQAGMRADLKTIVQSASLR